MITTTKVLALSLYHESILYHLMSRHLTHSSLHSLTKMSGAYGIIEVIQFYTLSSLKLLNCYWLHHVQQTHLLKYRMVYETTL